MKSDLFKTVLDQPEILQGLTRAATQHLKIFRDRQKCQHFTLTTILTVIETVDKTKGHVLSLM